MEVILDYWYIVVGLGALGAMIVEIVIHAIKNPERILEWLKYAVAVAEKEMGSGTGQLKLRKVYDLFLNKFKWASKLITFEQFSLYVDEALKWLNKQLESNPKFLELMDNWIIK